MPRSTPKETLARLSKINIAVQITRDPFFMIYPPLPAVNKMIIHISDPAPDLKIMMLIFNYIDKSTMSRLDCHVFEYLTR
jgi:hypothetical protein